MTCRGLRDRLAHGPPLLLDGATGTELTRRGADTSPPLFSARAVVDAPLLLSALHAEEVAAGADVVTACTFRTHGRSGWTLRAVELARASGARWVAGSLAPLADCWRPDLVPGGEDLARGHREQARRLAEAGVDLILVETIGTVRELVAAVVAAAETGLPVVACVTTDGRGGLLSGEPLAGAARSLPVRPDALGVNCVPARRLRADVGLLSAAAPGLPLAAYGNTGLPLDEAGERYTEPIDPVGYAELAREWIRAGATLVGGCCGTRPSHTAAIRRMLGPAE